MKLSYTAISLYKTCPRRYQYKYIDRVRDLRLSSALFFGGSLGRTFEIILQAKKDGKELPDPVETFNGQFKEITLANGEKYETWMCPLVRYYSSDFDASLLTVPDHSLIMSYNDQFNTNFTLDDIVAWYGSKDYARERLTTDQYQYANFVTWLSLRRKGLLLVDRFMTDFLPQVKRVHSLEKEITLDNGAGDIITGFSDLMCDLEYNGVLYENILLDFKTASAPYPKDSVLKSEQLSFYNYAERVKWCGYVVFLKKATKKDGFRMQIVIDEIPKTQVLKVVSEADEILSKIEEKQFDKNPNGCYSFGKSCEYYEICQLGTYSKYNFVEDSNGKN